MHVDKSLTLAWITYDQGALNIIGQHEELLVVRRDGRVERIDTIDLGFPLGLVADIADWVSEAATVLEPDDGIVLYTDDITLVILKQRLEHHAG